MPARVPQGVRAGCVTSPSEGWVGSTGLDYAGNPESWAGISIAVPSSGAVASPGPTCGACLVTPGSLFRFRHPVTVRFKDIDSGGHAHHSHALVYFEEARWAYFREVTGLGNPDDANYVLGDIHVRFLQRVLFPAVLDVGVRVAKVGKKTFVMEYEVLSESGDCLLTGESIQVGFDYGTGRAAALPRSMRVAMEKFDGPFA